MSKRRNRDRPGSLTVEDWLRAAAEAIDHGGVGSVAVEPLAAKLGVTKGSFYWHFQNRDALLQAVLQWWEQECTEAVIAMSNGIADPRERLGRVVLAATNDAPAYTLPSGAEFFLSQMFELALSDAADDPVVQPVLRRVAERRIQYLEECYRELGFSPPEAVYHALLAYAAYLGTLRLARETPDRFPRGAEYRTYQQHFIRALVPARAP